MKVFIRLFVVFWIAHLLFYYGIYKIDINKKLMLEEWSYCNTDEECDTSIGISSIALDILKKDSLWSTSSRIRGQAPLSTLKH